MSEPKAHKLEEQLAKAETDRDYWKNEYYRAYADIANLRKSLEKEREEMVRYRAEGFIDNLLPVLDGFHSALSTSPTSKETQNYLMGFQYVYGQLVSALESEGVVEITAKAGDDYDASTMHAVDAVESDIAPNHVVKVLAKGYKLHDRLVRPIMVSVSKKKEQPAPNPAQEKAKQA